MLQIGGVIRDFHEDGLAFTEAAAPSDKPHFAHALCEADYTRFGLDPDAPLIEGNGRAIRYWTADDIAPLLDQAPLPAAVLTLALVILRSNPMAAVGRRKGTLLVRASRAATPDRSAAHYKVLEPVREMLWRFCGEALVRERAELERYGVMLRHDRERRTEAQRAIDAGEPLIPGDPYRRFMETRNGLAETQATLSPPGVLFSTVCRQLYATFEPAIGAELVASSRSGESITASGPSETFISKTAFAIIPDGASVRLCHFSACGADRWHGRLFGTPLAAIDFAGTEYGIPHAAWQEDEFDAGTHV